MGGFVNGRAHHGHERDVHRAPGTTYCFSARAIDAAGKASPYRAEGCTAVPVDNPTFMHRGKWAKRSGAGYYLNTFSPTKQRGARLTLPGVQAKVLSLIVTKCRPVRDHQGLLQGEPPGEGQSPPEGRCKEEAPLRQPRDIHVRSGRRGQGQGGKLVIIEGLGVSAV